MIYWEILFFLIVGESGSGKTTIVSSIEKKEENEGLRELFTKNMS